MKINSFLTSKLFLKQLGIAFFCMVIIIMVTLFALKKYTHHGEKISTPNLYKLDKNIAIKQLSSLNLKYVIIDSLFKKGLKSGCVLNQHPKAGFNVKENRTVFLTINSIFPENVRIPNIKNNSFRQAVNNLLTSGFEIGKLEYVNSRFYNLVLYVKYKGDSLSLDDLVMKGAKIDIVLGKGRGPKVAVPDLFNDSFLDAKEEIIFSSLNLGSVKFDSSIKTTRDSVFAKVWKQRPSSNSRLQAGSYINIWLTKDSLRLNERDSLLVLDEMNF